MVTEYYTLSGFIVNIITSQTLFAYLDLRSTLHCIGPGNQMGLLLKETWRNSERGECYYGSIVLKLAVKKAHAGLKVPVDLMLH